MVLADLGGEDLILCMITTSHRDADSIPLSDADFLFGNLRQPSNIRPNKLFTGNRRKIDYSVGQLKPSKVKEVIDKLIDILTRTPNTTSARLDSLPANRQ